MLEHKIAQIQEQYQNSTSLVSESAKSCEMICKKLSDEILSRITSIEGKVQTLEEKFNDYLVMIDSASLPSATKEQAKTKIDVAFNQSTLLTDEYF